MFPADVVIVADTGWENDMLWSTGTQRTTAREFFEQVTKPLAESYGIDAAFVRTVGDDGAEYPPLNAAQLRAPKNGKIDGFRIIDIPLFGSAGGRLPNMH